MPSIILFDLCLWISSHQFVKLFRHYESPPFHTVIRIHLISLSRNILIFVPSHLIYIEQMLMSMLSKCDACVQEIMHMPANAHGAGQVYIDASGNAKLPAAQYSPADQVYAHRYIPALGTIYSGRAVDAADFSNCPGPRLVVTSNRRWWWNIQQGRHRVDTDSAELLNSTLSYIGHRTIHVLIHIYSLSWVRWLWLWDTACILINCKVNARRSTYS